MELITMMVAVVGLFSLLFLKSILMPAPRFPPGPRPWPILGNLLLIKNSKSTGDLANDLKAIYGPIFTLWMGSTPAVIISGPELLYEAMIKQGGNFMGRLQLPSVRIIAQDFRGLTSARDERHRLFRKLLVSEILSNSRLKEFRPIRDQEGDILIASLKKQARENGGLVTEFRSTVRMAITNLLIGICFGRRLSSKEFSDIDDVMDRRFKMMLGKPRDFVPLLRCFPDKENMKMQHRMKKTVDDVFMPLIEERRQMLFSTKISGKETFVDSLLLLQEEYRKGGRNNIEILDGDIVLLCLEILNAGTDTTSLNLEYAMANIINQPEIQQKLRQNISALVGDKVVDELDIPSLPYLQAVLKETLRRHSPARLAPSRVAVTSTKIAGYDIPAKTVILQHLEGVSLDSEIWENPLEFQPGRFLNRIVDITGSSGITFIPFGAGRRICPAINIAFLHGYLILARLVQAFEWKPATEGKLLDLTPDNGFSAPMRYPLTTIIQER